MSTTSALHVPIRLPLDSLSTRATLACSWPVRHVAVLVSSAKDSEHLLVLCIEANAVLPCCSVPRRHSLAVIPDRPAISLPLPPHVSIFDFIARKAHSLHSCPPRPPLASRIPLPMQTQATESSLLLCHLCCRIAWTTIVEWM